jgi:hypothetical protein
VTTRNAFGDRNRDVQDDGERHIYGEIEDVPGGGRIIRVKGTGTEDEEAFVMAMFGLGGRFPKDTNAEVHLVAGGSDTSLKFAMVMIPHDKERTWKEGTNGVQYWDDPKRAFQFGKKRAHLIDDAVAIGRKGNFEVLDNGDTVYIRGKKIVSEVPIVVGTPAFEGEE